MEKIIFFSFLQLQKCKNIIFSKCFGSRCLLLISHPCHSDDEKIIKFLKVAQSKATLPLNLDDYFQDMTNEGSQPIKIQVSQLKQGGTAFPFYFKKTKHHNESPSHDD